MTVRVQIRRNWKKRKRSAHKGNFGRVLILAGSRGMHGAAHLAGMGALRSGAGLVSVAVPQAIYTIVARREAELMVKPLPSNSAGSLSASASQPLLKMLENQDVLALGPGISRHPDTVKLVRKLIKTVKCPIVLDADGLNAFEGHRDDLKCLRGRAVLTPHDGEFKRLFGKRPPENRFERKAAVLKEAKKYGLTLVLKGYKTLVASPSGQLYENTTGNPGMATGGTGDILTGMTAGILAQGFDLFQAACFAVYLHGLAGDLAAQRVGEISMTAGDILEFLPAAFLKCGAGK